VGNIVPLTALVACLVEVGILLTVSFLHYGTDAARETFPGGLTPLVAVLFPALPFAAMGGVALLVRKNRRLSILVLTSVALSALIGILPAVQMVNSPGDFKGLGEFNAICPYLFQWLMVAGVIVVGFVTLAVTKTANNETPPTASSRT
jgi:hypothetical protein